MRLKTGSTCSLSPQCDTLVFYALCSEDNLLNCWNYLINVFTAVLYLGCQEHAEFYSQMMIRGGLRSTIEPDSSSL